MLALLIEERGARCGADVATSKHEAVGKVGRTAARRCQRAAHARAHATLRRSRQNAQHEQEWAGQHAPRHAQCHAIRAIAMLRALPSTQLLVDDAPLYRARPLRAALFARRLLLLRGSLHVLDCSTPLRRRC
jgi:hypothetical protein